MFIKIMNTQGQALERLMAQQPTNNTVLMNEAQADLKNAINKAVKAASDVSHTSA